MANATMSFCLVGNEMKMKKSTKTIKEVFEATPISSAFMIDVPKIKRSIKSGSFLKNKAFSISPMFVLGATTGFGGGGIFWDAFVTNIFPYMLDIAKVFCAIKIAQAFYQEKRGGRDGDSGLSAIIQYGKWYLLFWGLPIIVEMLDQIGSQMFSNLKK